MTPGATPDGAAPVYIRGVPHPLPAGERLLWEGAPRARPVGLHVFHVRALALYFAAVIGLWLFEAAGSTPRDLVAGFVRRALLAGIVLGIAAVLARAIARTAHYAITDRRIVLRLGIVVPMSINVPFSIIDSVDVRRFRDGTGQLAVRLARGQRIAYIALWPHCRAFTFAYPVPLLRGLTEPDAVGSLLATALQASIALSATATAVTPGTTGASGSPSTSSASLIPSAPTATSRVLALT